MDGAEAALGRSGRLASIRLAPGGSSLRPHTLRRLVRGPVVYRYPVRRVHKVKYGLSKLLLVVVVGFLLCCSTSRAVRVMEI